MIGNLLLAVGLTCAVGVASVPSLPSSAYSIVSPMMFNDTKFGIDKYCYSSNAIIFGTHADAIDNNIHALVMAFNSQNGNYFVTSYDFSPNDYEGNMYNIMFSCMGANSGLGNTYLSTHTNCDSYIVGFYFCNDDNAGYYSLYTGFYGLTTSTTNPSFAVSGLDMNYFNISIGNANSGWNCESFYQGALDWVYTNQSAVGKKNINSFNTIYDEHNDNFYFYCPIIYKFSAEEDTFNGVVRLSFFNYDDTESYYIDGYNHGKEEGYNDGYHTGYQEGYVDGEGSAYDVARNASFMSLFNSIADTPIRMLYSLFNFDLFGTSMLVVILSILTAIITLKIVKHFI